MLLAYINEHFEIKEKLFDFLNNLCIVYFINISYKNRNSYRTKKMNIQKYLHIFINMLRNI
ncbi:hypothetical protein PFTANZ_05646 [Plasmodium falciparum Tanzania (2000708)]|uniref:Uncharacterized protein n=2 Tax=Plasmodium falciparum TaxID=5833 RepID=A0A024W0F3_PLAFA|nr:hypothetical protein PFTANZ_05646 [Plasmodium falciparum Tanzania (2000708)]ETW58646.1 hypothetical protein PFMC_05743 [Plasmodium falciparum CAMP/Malaysia]